MDIFENLIPRKTITCNHNDPPWTNKEIRAVVAKNAIYKRLKLRMLNSNFLDKFKAFQIKRQSSINFSQFEYCKKALSAIGLH